MFLHEQKPFCCQGCIVVYELLTGNGLGHFYDLGPQAGIRVSGPVPQDRFRYLDEPVVRQQLLDYADETISRVTFKVPAVHCVACVWLLENLFRLCPGIGRSQVNFGRREVSITFEHERVPLSTVAGLLTSMGYEPVLSLASLNPETERPPDPGRRRLWLQLGVAGFAFGNIMLFSISSYAGLGEAGDVRLKFFLGLLSLLLAVPVLVFSARDYWRSAWLGLRQRTMTIDLPIAAGLAALFGQSVCEILTNRGEGYLDSLTGLVFFLLIGRVFQRKTYDRLSFDRDYRSFFPLSVARKTAGGEETVSISRLQLGDRIILRHGELIPADSRLVRGQGWIDYSFVTGEAEPVARQTGDYLYAGGQQMGGAIELETVKAVSQSYLASLWGHEAFAKDPGETLDTLTNRFSRRFTLTVGLVAVGAAVYWGGLRGDIARAIQAFASVLIVACPCALALAAPFALGTAQRFLARRRLFLKNPHVLEKLARVDTVVFDKTGTLTALLDGSVTFYGEPLGREERSAVAEVARHSTHPYSARIRMALAAGDGRGDTQPAERASESDGSFQEAPGSGVEGQAGGRQVMLGSLAWLKSRGIGLAPSLCTGTSATRTAGGEVHVALDGVYRGQFQMASVLRPEAEGMIAQLAGAYELALLSGDHARERDRFGALFPAGAHLHFNQSPRNKLRFIRDLQQSGGTVAMVGDGLNDAGALKQSDVGVAVVERVGAFSPASDVILAADLVPRLAAALRFSKLTVRIVWLSFLLSSMYNIVGISIAAGGLLSPLVCAVLMPLSSVTVVAFACGATHWLGLRSGLGRAASVEETLDA